MKQQASWLFHDLRILLKVDLSGKHTSPNLRFLLCVIQDSSDAVCQAGKCLCVTPLVGFARCLPELASGNSSGDNNTHLRVHIHA